MSSSGSPSGAVVAFDHVTKRYPGDVVAVDDLSLAIPAGEICVLVGPSGSGKTTTMRMINRLVEPTSGTITVDGQDVRSLPAVELRRRIGYVIQQVGLFPHLSVAGNVSVVPELLRWPRARIRERVDELLEMVGLDPGAYRDRYAAQLSGGERQRVGVARAMAADPAVLLMDEPFGAADPILRERLQNEFLRIQERLRKTIVFVTHDVDEAIKMADRIAILERGGRLAQYDTPAAILANPASEFVERFVGADRGLKRLSLARVRDLELLQPVTVTIGESRTEARRRLAAAGADYGVLIDDAARPLGWIALRDLGSGGEVQPDLASATGPLIARQSTLREALSRLVESGVLMGAVVDDREHLSGVLSVELISQLLAEPEGEREGPDAA